MSPENGTLGIQELPEEFSKDPEQRKRELSEAVMAGYNAVDRRYGRKAATSFNPMIGNNVFIFENQGEYLAKVFENSNDLSGVRARFANSPPQAWTSYPARQIYLDVSDFESPLQVAQSMAHETVHLWAGKNAVEVHMNPGSDAYINDRANEGLVDYIAMESLGLLKPPITNLKQTDLLLGAYFALIIRQLATGFEVNVEDKIFRITQGTFKHSEIKDLNRKMGINPMDPTGDTRFFEAGFILPVASLRMTESYINPDFMQMLNELVSNNLTWTKQGLRRARLMLSHLERPDVIEAKKRLGLTVI